MNNPPLRVVFDSNFILASVKRGSYAEQWLLAAATGELLCLFISPEILEEIKAKLETKFLFSRADAAAFLDNIRHISTVVWPKVKIEIASDPDDNKILECAIEAKANIIVTADRGLLELKQYQDVGIVHPNQLKYFFPN